MSLTVKGVLVAEGRDFSGYRVNATYEVPIGNDRNAEGTVTDRRIALVERSGEFVIELPEKDQRAGPMTFTVISNLGLETARVTPSEEELDDTVKIEVGKADEPTVVTPSTDPTLGATVNYSGRIIDEMGTGAPAGLIVVIWGVPPGGAPASAYPLAVSKTSAGGYVTGLRLADELDRAFIRVGGGEPVAIDVTKDKQFPLRWVAVLASFPAETQHDEDCGCDGLPRAPEAGDLTTNPETFAGDSGGCVDFTIPNRTLEEVTFQAVVRTTQPELKGTTPPSRPQVPTVVVNRLVELAKYNAPVVFRQTNEPTRLRTLAARAPFDTATGERAIPARIGPGASEIIRGLAGERAASIALKRATTMLGGISLDDPAFTEFPLEEVATAVLEERDLEGQPLRLEPSVIAELSRETETLTPMRLLTAEQSSVVRRFRTDVTLLAAPNPTRFELGDAYQVDWDEIPLAYQATTIAHGHLLTFKQVWKADGYSLGDLLYSLPLAPGQQKLISVLDWERRESDTRQARRQVTESLTADLTHDRDISDVIRTALGEQMRASSTADVSAVGGGIGGFIGPVVFGAAGGVSTASSTANQTSGRQVSGTALNRVRDRTLQAASAVRGQRSTVVQTSRQGESVRAQTEVVANYAHCHAMTVEYFEVLRHFQVRQELAHVQECLFIPFSISPFTQSKALRWRSPVEHALRRRDLRGAFDALERVATNWVDADVPVGRYADEQIVHLEGEMRMRMTLPRPADNEDDSYNAANWGPWTAWLWDTPENIWTRYLGVVTKGRRDGVWTRSIAPGIAQRIVDALSVQLRNSANQVDALATDPTLVSTFYQDVPLTVAMRIEAASLAGWNRSAVVSVEVSASAALPSEATVIIDSAGFRYRTDHLSHDLVRNRRVLNDLTASDTVVMMCPIDAVEKRNPRERDQRQAEDLLDHLDEYIEYYHRAIWMNMDPNRRYLLLDGFIAPDAGGRSVASVVENRVIGVVGNNLVMPVVPGVKLDATYEFGESTPDDLRHLYAGGSAPPMRISVPTKGVFAEAVLGKCNSCEIIDDTRFWRFQEEPIPDQPTPIEALSTDSRRRTPPNLAPDVFPDTLVRYQDVPESPDPTGLAAAMKTLGTAGIFKDITGLAMNQANSAQALKTAITTAQGFATRAGALAQQRFMNRELDRSMDRIKEARDKELISKEEAQTLTESAIRGAIGEVRPKEATATKMPEVKRAIERVTSSSKGGSLRVTRPEGTVEVNTGASVSRPAIDVSVDPEVVPIKQQTNLVCWAAAGAMLLSWRNRQSMTVESSMDSLGGDWRAKYDANQSLSSAEFRGFVSAVGLSEEGPASYIPDGIARLLENHGPLFVVSDDMVENNALTHARIVTAIRGDGTADGTDVTLADSATGTLVTEKFTEFARRLEASDTVNFGAGIYHF